MMLILHFQWFNAILQNSWKFNTRILQVGENFFLSTTGYMSLKELYKTKIQKICIHFCTMSIFILISQSFFVNLKQGTCIFYDGLQANLSNFYLLGRYHLFIPKGKRRYTLI